MSEEIGKVKYTIDADISGVKEGISDAKAEVEGFGANAESAGSKAEKSFSGAAGAIDSVSSKLAKATGIVAAFGAAIAGVVKAYQAIADYIRNGETIAELFTADLDTVNNTKTSLDQINQKIIEVSSELAAKEEGDFLSLFGRRRGQIEEELDALTKRQRSISAQVRRQRTLEYREAADAFIQTAKDVSEQAQLSLLPDEDRIAALAEKQKQALIKAADEARVDIQNKDLQAALQAIEAIKQAEIAAQKAIVKEREDAENQRIQRTADREAKAIASAIERALAPVIAGLTSSFGTGFTTQLNQITTEIQTATDEIRKIKRGR